MKRRSLTLVLCLLATLSLASVGFAAWVISAGDTEGITGAIKVETVTDERLVIKNVTVGGVGYNVDTDTWAAEAPKFIFGNDGVTAQKWLKNDQASVLSLKVTFEVWETVKSSIGNTETEIKSFDKIEFANEFTTTSLSAGKDESDNDMVYAVVVDGTPDATWNAEDDCFEFTIALKWGDFFGAVGNQKGVAETNPFTYYNKEEFSEELANDAYAKLNKMYQDMQSAQYTVEIDVQYK